MERSTNNVVNMIINKKRKYFRYKLMIECVNYFIVQLSFSVILLYFFIFHADLLFSLAYNVELVLLHIFIRFQMAVIDIEFSRGENVVFPLKPIVKHPFVLHTISYKFPW